MVHLRLILIIMILAIAGLLRSDAYAAPTLDGPYAAQVMEVLDGDTVRMRVSIWIGQDITTLVRIRGIDTPERSSKCLLEREKAGLATDYLEHTLSGKTVTLHNIGQGKYAGRIVADINIHEGEKSVSIYDMMIKQDYVRSYDGGKRTGWC